MNDTVKSASKFELEYENCLEKFEFCANIADSGHVFKLPEQIINITHLKKARKYIRLVKVWSFRKFVEISKETIEILREKYPKRFRNFRNL